MFAIDPCTSVLTIGVESVTIEMSLEEYNWGKSDRLCTRLFVCFCCFTSHVNSYGHCGTVSSLNHTFSWAGLSKRLTSICAHTFACN